MYAGPSWVRVASVATVAPLARGSEAGTGVGGGVCPAGGDSAADGATVATPMIEGDGDGAALPAQLESTIEDARTSATRQVMAIGTYVTRPRSGHCGKHLNLKVGWVDSRSPSPMRRPWLA